MLTDWRKAASHSTSSLDASVLPVLLNADSFGKLRVTISSRLIIVTRDVFQQNGGLIHRWRLTFPRSRRLFAMTVFTGQVSTKPKRQAARWQFVLWNPKANERIRCTSSKRFEAENRNAPLVVRPSDEVEVVGELLGAGTLSFDIIKVLKTA